MISFEQFIWFQFRTLVARLANLYLASGSRLDYIGSKIPGAVSIFCSVLWDVSLGPDIAMHQPIWKGSCSFDGIVIKCLACVGSAVVPVAVANVFCYSF